MYVADMALFDGVSNVYKDTWAFQKNFLEYVCMSRGLEYVSRLNGSFLIREVTSREIKRCTEAV